MGAQAFAQPQYGQSQYGQPQYGLAGLGQSAFGYGPNFGNAQGWGQNFGGQWQQHRQLSHQDVGEVVRQLLPILPQVIAQAQQPQAAFGQGAYGAGFGAAYGPGARNLSQQDVNEVVRQIMPVIPQIVGLLQGQQQASYANAAYGGGQGQGWNNNQGWNNPGQQNQGAYGYGNQNPFQLSLFGQNQQNPFGAYGQAAFGGNQGQGLGQGQQRQLNQIEVGEIVRHLTAALPQVIANLQAINQQPNMQRAA